MAHPKKTDADLRAMLITDAAARFHASREPQVLRMDPQTGRIIPPPPPVADPAAAVALALGRTRAGTVGAGLPGYWDSLSAAERKSIIADVEKATAVAPGPALTT